MFAVLVLAGFMALFGVLGYLRGIRSTLITLALVLTGLVGTERLGPKLVALLNAIWKGIRFVLSGGLPALAGGSNAEQALSEALSALNRARPLIDPNSPGPALAMIFLALAGLGLLLGALKIFKRVTSGWGLVLGLFNGYVVGSYLLRRLVPGINLPALPGLPGQPPLPGFPTVPGGAVVDRILVWLTSFDRSTLGLVLALMIVLFVLFSTRLGGRGAGKKG